jgi:hypothetical protein
MAVADSRERFHTKEKSIEKRTGPHFGDGMWLRQIQRSESDVDQKVDAENNASESRPAQGQDQVVRVSQIERLGIELNKFELTGTDPDIACPSPHIDQIGAPCGSASFSAREQGPLVEYKIQESGIGISLDATESNVG